MLNLPAAVLRLFCAGAVLAAACPVIATAEPIRVCQDQMVETSPDGRLLGHLRYGETPSYDLAAVPGDFGLGQSCLLHRDAAAAIVRLLEDARADGIKDLRGISCFRSVERQRSVFCGAIGPEHQAADAAERARQVGPPGYSEHATGYSLDFAVRPSPDCPDLDACIAVTPGGRWLLAHAAEHGFELSFPSGNAQGVTWEPWHWRWVGPSASTPGADRPRALFAVARDLFRPSPGIGDPQPETSAPVRARLTRPRPGPPPVAD